MAGALTGLAFAAGGWAATVVCILVMLVGALLLVAGLRGWASAAEASLELPGDQRSA